MVRNSFYRSNGFGEAYKNNLLSLILFFNFLRFFMFFTFSFYFFHLKFFENQT